MRRDQPIEFMHRIGYHRTLASYGLFQGLLSGLDAAALEAALVRWAVHLLGEPAVGELRATALDGKASRGSLTPFAALDHLLAAMDQRTGGVLGQRTGGVLGQRRVDAKTYEHKTATELLRGLTLAGRVVTGDAMFCQRDLSKQLVEAGGHYLWKVDANQPSLLAAIGSAFEPARSPLAGDASRPGSLTRPARSTRTAIGSSGGRCRPRRCSTATSTGPAWPRCAGSSWR